MNEHAERYWEARWRDEKAINDALIAALRRIRSLEEKNVPKYAKQIARDALDVVGA